MHKVLYDNRWMYRFARHVSFWIFLYVLDFSVTLIFLYPRYLAPEDFQILFAGFHYDVLFFLADVLFTYSVVYKLYPLYTKNKKLTRFVLSCLILLLAAYIWKFIVRYVANDVTNLSGTTLPNILWLTFIAFLNAGPAIKCILFLACKYLKEYYIELESLYTLQREKSEAEIQLLKAQVHPHFLFNTLNNIYSSILTHKHNASDLVSRLAGTLNYMISECQAAKVPLSKEIEMIKDYIELEKVRYGDRIAIETRVTGNTDNKMIAPLLLIPLVENCFKHGTSHLVDQCFLGINFFVGETVFTARIENSKPVSLPVSSGVDGIGLCNVKKRLELLYKGKGALTVQSTPSSFIASITIPVSINQVKELSFINSSRHTMVAGNNRHASI